MSDKDIILNLGGPTKVATLLGLDKRKGGVQRVQNWMTRGIPPAVKLKWPELFLPQFSTTKQLDMGEQDRNKAIHHCRRSTDPAPFP